MKNRFSYQPMRYYTWTLLLTWAALFTAAWLSHRPDLAAYQAPLMLAGMLVPFLVAMVLIYRSGDRALMRDFKHRLLNLKLIRPRYWAALLLLIPAAVITATALSLLIGESAAQFQLSPEFTVGGGQVFFLLVVLLLAPTFEELGWRGYGVDSLNRPGRSLFTATLLFAVLWNLWHLPLFFVKGYYHYEILHENPLFALNFIVALFPAAILMNWIFYKNGRSIPAIIFFHFMLNLFAVLLPITQVTKCVVTAVMAVIAGVVVWRNRAFFFDKIEEAPLEKPRKETTHELATP